MKRKPFLVALSLISITLASGCTTKQEHISVQKYEGENYKFEAYKEKIEMGKTEKTKEIVKNADWEEFALEKDHPKADFIFYFNDEKSEGKIAVFYVWVNTDENIVELTKDEHSHYVQLNRKDSETILRLLH
ncbi:hypothetical protein [Peribacillus simplex]|uniref:Lipoprotein n=2 Tax=Peribacillus simplex TaxID=1478 RepID=A0A223EEI0_9BACI|nr:hypothetical protein [Peribacillus simplex]ASS93659.1 hypothetical protein BS1321_06540 [Peribacillus simplex NBRC 15720 = DSM 1321]MEC1399345.1 hypothetical protein [Peribacillus simplex]MED3908870.1 hypothetical protein [Peribacillus simplex]MED3983022.1 hypothetical protein [Peribacillus simplex]MED4095434.1 hypothetical protein [Peribacillus simplex]